MTLRFDDGPPLSRTLPMSATTVRTVAMVMTAVVMLEPGSAFVPLQQPCATAVSFFSPGTRLPWTCLRSALRVERRRVLSRGRGSARWRPPTALVSWSDLEDTTPRILPSVFSEAELSEPIAAGKTVLYRDANGWCPYAERVWLALELKNADYVTCLVDNEDAAEPGSVGSLPRVRWADGTSDDGSNILSILERIEREYPQAPALFPDMSASVDYVRDSFERFDGIMPRFTKPSRAAPYVLACKIQRAGSFEIENCELGELVPKFKYDVSTQSELRGLGHNARIGYKHTHTHTHTRTARTHAAHVTHMHVYRSAWRRLKRC